MPQSATHTYRTETGKTFQVAQAHTPGAGGADPEARTESAAKGEPEHHPGEMPNANMLFANSIVSVVILLFLASLAVRKRAKIPTGFGNFAEYIVEQLNAFTVGIIGPGGEKHTPYVGTVFLYILVMNLIGIVPGMHSPTTNLSLTLALGVVTFCYVQAMGIRTNGPLGYLKHFAGPIWWLAPLMFTVEVVSECVKPFTLAIRLFGNIFGEDVIIAVVAALGVGSIATRWIPFQFPIVMLSLLTDFVQALIFATLTCIYLSLVTQHEDGHHAEGHAEAARSPATGH
jgi:F-type H+-transporting ATPase subunit a